MFYPHFLVYLTQYIFKEKFGTDFGVQNQRETELYFYTKKIYLSVQKDDRS